MGTVVCNCVPTIPEADAWHCYLRNVPVMESYHIQYHQPCMILCLLRPADAHLDILPISRCHNFILSALQESNTVWSALFSGTALTGGGLNNSVVHGRAVSYPDRILLWRPWEPLDRQLLAVDDMSAPQGCLSMQIRAAE
jgi:hypothetical protein